MSELDGYILKSNFNELVQRVRPGYEVTERQIETAVETGHLKPLKVGNVRLFPRHEVETWLTTVLRPSHTAPGRLRVKSPRELERDTHEPRT